MRIVRELPEAVRVVRHVWIPMRDGVRLVGAAVAAGELGAHPGAGDPRVHPVPQGRPFAPRRRAAPPLLGGPRLRERARRLARQRRLRGHPHGRVPAAGAGRRRGRARLARRAAVVQRPRRHDRHLVGRLQRPAGRRAAPAAARLRRQPLLDRRPLRRRRPLHGRCAARHRHARLGVDDARVQLAPAGPRDRRRGRWRAMWLQRLHETPPVDRGLGLPPAPRRVLEAGLGVRRLRRAAGARVHGRRLERRLHERDPALPRGLRRAAQGPDRAVVAQLPRGRHARPGDRLPAGDAALVRPLAARPRDGDHGRAAAACLDAGVGGPVAASRPPRRALDHGALVAVAGDPGGSARDRLARARQPRRGRCDPALRRALRARRRCRQLVSVRLDRRRAARPARGGWAHAVPRLRPAERAPRAPGPPRRGARADGRQAARAGRRAALRRRTRRLVAAARTRLPQPHPPRLARASRVRSGRRAHDRARGALRRGAGDPRRPPAAALDRARLLAVDLALARGRRAHAAHRR